MKIGKKLRDRREDKDLTQSKVAKYAGIDQSNYSKMERDLGEPNLDQLRLLCEILEIDANELLNLKIHTEDEPRPILSLISMRAMEEKLPADRFIRVHRSFIVQKQKIKVIDKGRIVFGKEYIPISDSYKQELQNYVNKHTI